MSKKIGDVKSLVVPVDPTECPFREFRDNELSIEYWGLGPSAMRTIVHPAKSTVKPPADYVWVDEQTQPLPRSVRHYLHGWIRAEELAMRRWKSEVVVFEEEDSNKMSVIDVQLTHAQVLLRSSFCRRVLSACYILEKLDPFLIEHQWENFICSITPEGWRARYHIYSPGMKAGGGMQHRPGLSKNGCYLVRLFYLGTWRCVWVSDQVPVDANEAPLLPFSPLLNRAPAIKPTRQMPAIMDVPSAVLLWPLLLCKALLKLAAPDMNSDEDVDCYEDEDMMEFSVMHSLTGGLNLKHNFLSHEDMWQFLTTEVPVFSWDDDDDTLTSTAKSRSTKKPSAKETTSVNRRGTTTITLVDTKDLPPYALPGITPGHEMKLLVTMARDLPYKKPLPEPDVALWKYYRWVDWARRHGLYEAYDCPRTRFLKVNGLLKLSYAPHLLDVQSTESITFGFREDNEKSAVEVKVVKKGGKDATKSVTAATSASNNNQIKEELREWIPYESICLLVKYVSMLYNPSMFQYTTAASNPPLRITKAPNKVLDILAPKSAPLYLQIDGPDTNILRISLNVLHPRVLLNCSVPLVDYIEPAYLILEEFEWFDDCEIPMAKGFVQTRGYDSIEIEFQPGRHFCRIWVHSCLNWHIMLLSESSLLLGTRDTIQSATVRDCPWASRFLSNLSLAFSNWIRLNRSSHNMVGPDRDFYRSYQPDLTWDPKVVGYDKTLLHWMFRQALQDVLQKRLSPAEYSAVSAVLRRYFCDPDFGFPPKPVPKKSLKDIVTLDPCDCVMPEVEEVEADEEQLEEQIREELIVDHQIMEKLLSPPNKPVTSQVCELATTELPCGVLKEERDKVIKRHEAATCLQAHWRGTWARKCLTSHISFTPDITKIVMDNAFGNLETLSLLMNQFFLMYPGAKHAYSVASALSGVYGLSQYPGTTPVTPKCKWVPYFQGVFYCHGPVKVHFDLQSTLQNSTVAVYDNDTGKQMPQVYNAHVTFDFSANIHGYTVIGHSTLHRPPENYYDVHWQLTVLSSTHGLFHICDNDVDCKEIPLPHASKLHVDEMFIPNRRNILGGIQLFVSKHEAVSFRAAATSPNLEMVAILRMKTEDTLEEVARCSGTGELYWPYISLQPTLFSQSVSKVKYISQSDIASRSAKLKPQQKGSKNKGVTKLKDLKNASLEKQYSIEVIAPNGWPLLLDQWIRVDEVRNSRENLKIEAASKKPVKEKVSAKEKAPVASSIRVPQPGDAYVELECSLAVAGGITAKRDDTRDMEFVQAIKSWDANEVGRNLRGAQIRKDFRTEFLEAPPVAPSESVNTMCNEEVFGEEIEGEEFKRETQEPNIQQGPTPATESGLLEMSVESEEEPKYLTLPDQLRDKFIPLYFLPFCTKEVDGDETALESLDMAEAAKKDRLARIDAAIERLNELQAYDETHVLGRQKNRCQQLEKFFVDSHWSENLTKVLEERDDAIARETLERNLSATKKKLETVKKK